MICNSKLLEGKTALITGCNRGIGLEIMNLFASEGANIIACTRSSNSEFESKLSELSQRNGISIYPFYFDFCKEEEIKLTLQLIFKQRINIDILVNNAGIVTKGLLQMTSIESIKKVFQINFFSQVILTQYVLKIMSKNGSGSIINLGSVGGIDAFTANTSYGSSKAAFMYFTKSISQEYAARNIRVNAIAPSMTDTNMAEEMGKEANEEILRRSAIKRLANPQEIAQLALFLASDKSSFINGQIIRIDGGM